jgi:hypothetical protein
MLEALAQAILRIFGEVRDRPIECKGIVWPLILSDLSALGGYLILENELRENLLQAYVCPLSTGVSILSCPELPLEKYLAGQ